MTIEVYYPDGSYKSDDILKEYQKLRDLGAVKCFRWTSKECQSQNEDFYRADNTVIGQLCHPGYPPQMPWLEYVFVRPEKKREISGEQFTVELAAIIRESVDFISEFDFHEVSQVGSIINVVVSRTEDGPRESFCIKIEEI